MTTDALLPCPFCQPNPEYDGPQVVPSDLSDGRFVVLCPTCAAAGPIETTEAKAAEYWNRRAAPATPPREPTGEMWKSGRLAFVDQTEKYHSAATSIVANAYADVSPAIIWRAMWDAAPAQPPRDGVWVTRKILQGVYDRHLSVDEAMEPDDAAPAQPTQELTLSELIDEATKIKAAGGNLLIGLSNRFHITRKAAP